MVGGWFCTSSASQHFLAHMHQSVEECSCGNDDAFSLEGYTPASGYSSHFTVFHEQFVYGILPDMEVRNVLQYFTPSPDKFATVALGARAPHSRTFRAVEHSELDGSAVGYQPHVSAQCVNFSNDLAFGDATHGRVTTHLSNLVHVHGDETGLGT